MSSCSAEFEHAVIQMGMYVSQPIAPTKVETLKEKARFVEQQPSSPRASPVPTYFSGISRLAQRVCAWVKQKFNAMEQATSRFAYENACGESLVALDLALSSGNKDFSKNQLLNLMQCRSRQGAYLKLQKPAVAKGLDDLYQASLIARCKDRSEELKKLSDTMDSGCRRGRNAAVKRGFVQAKTVCNLLKQKALLASKQY